MVRLRPLVLPLLLLCLACGGPGEKPVADTAAPPPVVDDQPRDGGTLYRRLDTDIATLNPVVSTSRSDRLVANLLFTPLIYIDRDLQPIPGLADSWEISDDGLLYTFDLNPKATFSDGRPVRPRDVIFTLEKILDPKSEAVQITGSFDLLDVARTRVVDEDTVEIAFKQALATQLIKFNDVIIVPEHVYAPGNFRKDYNDRAVGSGPYRLVRWVPGKEVVVERRADYWGKRPYIQTVVFKVIGDHGTAFNALKRGELDESIVPSDTWWRERNNPEVTKKIEFQRFYTRNYNFIAWNNRNPLLSDKRVRRALAMSIPIESIIKDIFHDTARAMTGHFTPDEWAYNPTVPAIRHDLDGARKLLAAAGFVDSNGDGVVEKNGRPFKISIVIIAGSSTAQQIAQMVQAELKKVGVQLDIALMDGAMAITRILAGNYEAAYLSWDLDPDPDPYILFHSSQIPPRGQNVVYYTNPEADRLIDAARRELDAGKRKDLYWRLHEVLSEDQPYAWIVQVSAKWAMSKRVHGVVPSRGFGLFNWYPAENDWWIAPER
ncbi:MAG TPA: ABC transporter substrate-binding protein [Thermoanaerobaculia bacterium]|nr:ABC transporter substrate-binding protein [Thermoanaerobaculia bacterium]